MTDNYQQEFLFEGHAKCVSYGVHDIIPENLEGLKAAFILESPYRDEVAFQCPVAGASGKAISRYMGVIDPKIPSNLPFGRYLKKSKDGRFAVLNCSNYPMDANAYRCTALDVECLSSTSLESISRVPEDIQNDCPGSGRFNIPYDPEVLDKIRRTIQVSPRRSRDAKYVRTLDLLTVDFRERVSRVLSREVLVIVCGSIAKNFLELSGVVIDARFICVPHPSRNQWNQVRYRELMLGLKNRLSVVLL